ncbi:MAG: carbamoyl phosphate synthase [Actinomycetota bacterium]|nr:carbamoyl phosphate synthase [Actinomycetota bacterium]
MFERVLIANRGEIAVRIARTCRELGVTPVGVYSSLDRNSLHVSEMYDSVGLEGDGPAATYLNADALITAAQEMGADAIHPGYGFLSEDASFAEAATAAGIIFIGPPAEALRASGDKLTARRLASAAGVPTVPGGSKPCADHRDAADLAARVGFPVAIKAAGGGGGRGLKVARTLEDVPAAFDQARREAQAYFSTSEVYVERYLPAPKHLEVQILSPSPGQALWLGMRDCSLQRRNQKLVEETPPALFRHLEEPMGAAAVNFSLACGYLGVGTVEMLVDPATESFYFLEMNARLQVEHTVTEEVFGLDLVACQLMIAAGEWRPTCQDDLRPRGHAIECRINAEDPARGFAPAPGRITGYREPAGPGVRVDSGYRAGDEVPSAYDSLIAKLITWGSDRDQALRRMRRSLDDYVIEGLPTTISAHRVLLSDESFLAGSHTTATVSELTPRFEPFPAPTTGSTGVVVVGGRPARLWHPSMAGVATHAAGSTGGGVVVASMQAVVLEILVSEGDTVAPGAALVRLEAMKMETVVCAPREAEVTRVAVVVGETVTAGAVVVELKISACDDRVDKTSDPLEDRVEKNK